MSAAREQSRPRRPPYRVGEAIATPYPGPPAKPIRGPDDVLEVCGAMGRHREERFVVLLLNARHELQRKALVSKGSLNASIVHPREVFLPAIRLSVPLSKR